VIRSEVTGSDVIAADPSELNGAATPAAGEPERTVMILVDGLRHDWASAERMPFTGSLAERGRRRTLRDTFGFVGIRAAIFHGLEPSESGMVFLYARAPDARSSEFRWVRHLPRALYRRPFVRGFQAGWDRLRARLQPGEIPIWTFNAIPHDLAPRFRFGEPYHPRHPRYLPGRRSFFDRFGPGEVLYLAYPDREQRTQPLLDRFVRQARPETRFSYVHFAELDWEQHRSGPDGAPVQRVLSQIDRAIESLHAHALRLWPGPVRFLIFGDHGAVLADKTFDIESHLGLDPEAPEARRGIDYFIDSTMARFWFDESTRSRQAGFREALSGLDCGRIVSPADLPQLGCRYDRNTFGDLFFCLNEGWCFFPSFFHRDHSPPGMHGYLPDVQDNNGALVLCTERGPTPELPERILEMTDLHRILTDQPLGAEERPPLSLSG
jgi:hypothetical protein